MRLFKSATLMFLVVANLTLPNVFAESKVFVGKIGFDLDRVGNERSYEVGFQSFLLKNLENTVIASLDLGQEKLVFDVNAYGNSSYDDVVTYSKRYPASEPSDGVVWNGTDNIDDIGNQKGLYVIDIK